MSLQPIGDHSSVWSIDDVSCGVGHLLRLPRPRARPRLQGSRHRGRLPLLPRGNIPTDRVTAIGMTIDPGFARSTRHLRTPAP